MPIRKKAQSFGKLLQFVPLPDVGVVDLPSSPGKSKKSSSVPQATCQVVARRAKPGAGGKKNNKTRHPPA
jgi:hypothetical protein